MKRVPAFEAKTRFSALIDEASRGETIIITRRGLPVAQIGPMVGTDNEPELAMSFLLSQDIGLGMPIRAAIDEGRKR
ncbi:MAG: type II toxin-antitoxin system Phd/YefM family antitoxin [Vulcanimicrobiaceae bacterium]